MTLIAIPLPVLAAALIAFGVVCAVAWIACDRVAAMVDRIVLAELREGGRPLSETEILLRLAPYWPIRPTELQFSLIRLERADLVSCIVFGEDEPGWKPRTALKIDGS